MVHFSAHKGLGISLNVEQSVAKVHTLLLIPVKWAGMSKRFATLEWE
jgi:hypothetical protein